MSVNKVILVGNVGGNPEFRSTSDNKEISYFSLATNEYWKDKNTGERKDKTEWHRIVIFNQNIVNIIKNYVNKGTKLYVEGQLQTRKWTDQNSVERYTTEIVVGINGEIKLLSSKGENNGASPYEAPTAMNNNSNNNPHNNEAQIDISSDTDDDIPF